MTTATLTILQAVRLANTGALLWDAVGPLIQTALEAGENEVTLEDLDAAAADAQIALEDLRAAIAAEKKSGSTP